MPTKKIYFSPEIIISNKRLYTSPEITIIKGEDIIVTSSYGYDIF